MDIHFSSDVVIFPITSIIRLFLNGNHGVGWCDHLNWTTNGLFPTVNVPLAAFVHILNNDEEIEQQMSIFFLEEQRVQ